MELARQVNELWLAKKKKTGLPPPLLMASRDNSGRRSGGAAVHPVLKSVFVSQECSAVK